MISSEAGIIGHGSAAYHKKPQQPLFGYMAEAARAALCRISWPYGKVGA